MAILENSVPISNVTAPAANATERAYQTMLGWIENRQIGPGFVLDERRLSGALDISRTPLRNALNRLLGEGYLVRLVNGTIMIREVGVGEVLELLYVRRLLEPDAVMLAVGRIPADALEAVRDTVQHPDSAAEGRIETWQAGDELHDIICDYCTNRSLANILRDARRRIRMSNIERVPGRGAEASEEHLLIINAILNGNAEQARDAMAAHLQNISQRFLATYEVRSEHRKIP